MRAAKASARAARSFPLSTLGARGHPWGFEEPEQGLALASMTRARG